jgi:hypothetical protein
MLGGRTRPHDLGTLSQSVARTAVREFEQLLASPAGGELASQIMLFQSPVLYVMPLRTIIAAVHLVLFDSKHVIGIVAQRIKFDIVLKTSELVMWG